MEVHFVDVKVKKRHARPLPCVVGRGEDAGFKIKNDSVSRRHCTFTLDDGVVRVTDHGSTNGTYVGKQKLTAHAATPVPNGAQVRIGGIVLRIEYTVAAKQSLPEREGDTVPLADAELPELEPVTEPSAGPLPELEPVAEAIPELEPVEPEAEPVAATAATPVFPDVEPAAPAADFAGLAAVEPEAAPADGAFDFLGGEAAAPPKSDDKLDDFFKSLS